jgi:hypothetical protein
MPGGSAQAVDHLTCKHKTLSSSPSTAKNRKKKKKTLKTTFVDS